MERRIYFICGDLLNCVAAGAAGSWLAYLAVPGDWSGLTGMGTGMIAGMVLGMVAGMIVSLFFSPLFGAMEVMLPASLSGMLGGMAGGMFAPMFHITEMQSLLLGIAAGILSMAATYLLQAMLEGDAA